jgi:hypothetical protein
MLYNKKLINSLRVVVTTTALEHANTVYVSFGTIAALMLPPVSFVVSAQLVVLPAHEAPYEMLLRLTRL